VNISDQGMQLLREGGLSIVLEAVVLSTRTFSAAGELVAKVTVIGSPGGPMGQGVNCIPYGIFELDADLDVYRALEGMLAEPVRVRFQADLKPINSFGGYVVHLLKVLHILAESTTD